MCVPELKRHSWNGRHGKLAKRVTRRHVHKDKNHNVLIKRRKAPTLFIYCHPKLDRYTEAWKRGSERSWVANFSIDRYTFFIGGDLLEGHVNELINNKNSHDTCWDVSLYKGKLLKSLLFHKLVLYTITITI